ncbi:MAG: DNA topoisomerase III [Oscillospiraceae bacterium]|jgi:DNA topoisomerase-3|nr:DNA topoisomerase III [Oscillospiraceae bacterium]
MPGKALVLAEKPSVAREIAKVLGARQGGEGYLEGPQYVVTWALGHLVTLADPEAYGEQYKTWNLESLPMLPKKMQLVVIKETSKQFRVVQSLLKRGDIGEIVIATDSGREGELVARWILLKAGCRKPLKRLWISSQTVKAVKEGFASLRPGGAYDNLYLSAQARAEADWLVGLNVTRALTCKYNAQLSGGRVQTPTLALIVAREQEIRNFQPREFYTIRAKFEGFSARWVGVQQQSRLFDRTAAESILAAVQGKSAVVTTVAKQFKSKAPPAAYDLTELQRDANRRYAYSAKETLACMQALYERHKLLTYPRTDSRYITPDVAATLPERLRSIAVGPYREIAGALLRGRLSTRYLVDASKVTDHHAIIPTEEPVNLAALSPEERRVYDLVVRRFLAVLSQPFEYEETKLTIAIGKESFAAGGKTVKSPGWKAAYEKAPEPDEPEEEEEDTQNLPVIRQGDRLRVLSCAIETGKTKPPARYTEATLLSAMENPPMENRSLRDIMKNTSGLGTPATRADIIEKLFASFYMERHGKELVPTSKGIQLISLVPADLKSAELTARWEQQLMLISQGQARGDAFLEEMRSYTARLVSQVIASSAVYHHDNQTREKCPECSKFLLAVNGKKGKLLVCPDRACGYRRSLSIQTNARCPNCHKKLELRGEGEKRIFVCVCGYREKYADFEKRRVDTGAGKREVEKFLAGQQPADGGNFALAAALAKWQENKEKE